MNRDKFLIIFSRAVLCIGVMAFTAYSLKHFRSAKERKISLPALSDVQSSVDLEGDLTDMTNRLIVESIVAIIQNYYVDADRVLGDYLLNGTFKKLQTEFPEIELVANHKDIVISANGVEISSLTRNPVDYESLVETFVQISRYIDRKHYADIPQRQEDRSELTLSEGYYKTLDSLLKSLDAHSKFLKQEEYDELRQGTEGQFGGLGILVGIRNNILTVIKPLPRSPALRAGIRKSDRILSIDDVDTFGFTLDELVDYMRGEPGTSVGISVLREGRDAPMQMNLLRERINVDSVTSEKISKNGYHTAYIAIENFSSRTSQEVWQALRNIRDASGEKFNGVVLDLRSNPGGLLDQAVQVADLFLEKGVVVSTRGRREEIERAGQGIREDDFPIIVLVNGDTASASEIVSGALQDHQRALVVGQPTFGKGTVQTIFELPGGQALKLTVARYYTPSDRSIQTVGVIPDIWLQPIYRSDRNLDLMGSYHYRSERFLSNHISLQAGFQDGERDQSHSVLYKSYYLTDREEEDILSSDSQEKDIELNVALSMLTEIANKYGTVLPDEVKKVPHWVHPAMSKVKQEIQALHNETISWFKQKHSVDWDGNHHYASEDEVNSGRESGLSLKMHWDEVDELEVGKTVYVPFSISNESFKHYERMSLFVWTQEGHVYREKALGKLRSGDILKEKIGIKLLSDAEDSKVRLNVTLAIDALPLAKTTVSRTLTSVSSKSTELQMNMSLRDGSSGNGILDAKEAATLELTVKNNSSWNAENLTLNIVNLCGKQISLKGKNKLKIGSIPKLSQKKVSWRVEASEKMVSPTCFVGVEAYNDQNENILSRGMSFPTSAADSKGKHAELIGH